MTLVSPCCGVTVRVCLQIETNWYECTKCGKPCDPVEKKSDEPTASKDR